MITLIRDGSCPLHMCSGTGHTVCNKTYDWVEAFTAAVNRLMMNHALDIPANHREEIAGLLALAPTTSEP